MLVEMIFLHNVIEPMDTTVDTTVDAFNQSEGQILAPRPARSWDL
jgi:hypothetical protein